MKRRSLPILLLLFFAAISSAQAQESGLSFLRVGSNAAGVALGDAYVAHTRDAWAAYWNPAGLAAAPNTAALSHHIWIAQVRTYSVAARLGVGARGGAGFFVSAAGRGDGTEPAESGESFFDAEFVTAGGAYAHELGPLRVGASAKYVAERIYPYEADGYAFDFGLQLEGLDGMLQFGAAVQNLGRLSEGGTASAPLPRTLRAGATLFPFRIRSEEDGAPLLNTFITGEVSHLLASDDTPEAGSDGEATRWHIGAAAEVMELVVVRAGFVSNSAVRGFSFGGGLGYGAFLVDYAFVPFEGGFAQPGHVLTLAYRW